MSAPAALPSSHHGTSSEPTGIMSWLTTVDHKKIGFLYGFFALIFFLVGGFEALLIRTQLMVPNNNVLSPINLSHQYAS